MALIEKALKISTEAHRGQFRRDGITPYITHPIAVAEKFLDSYLKIISLLHDVIEDSSITKMDLKNAGIPRRIIEAVVRLTRIKNEPYLDYLLEIKKDSLAKAVKIEDIKHNLSTLDPKSKTVRDKYLLALHVLEY